MNSAQVQPASTFDAQPPGAPAWFCLRTHSKHEHIAGRWLEQYLGIETYAPRIRFRRSQSRGPVWFTEALFPNYLFARFELAQHAQNVEAAPGIRRVVRFGAQYPRIPDETIDDLRATMGADEVRTLEGALRPGELVRVAGGPFHGLQAVVSRAMPGSQRVDLLLEFLGRQTTVGVSCASVVPVESARCTLLAQAATSVHSVNARPSVTRPTDKTATPAAIIPKPARLSP